MRDMFSNSPTFNMDTNMDGCDCEDCDCSDENDCGCGGEHKVYGINMQIGPNGVPVIKEWGNTPPLFGLPSIFNGMPQFGGSTKKKTLEKPITTNIDFIDNPAEGKGKIIAEMPGVNKDDIKVTYREQKMHIQANGEVKEYKERIGVPAIDEKSIKATYKNGILEVVFNYDHNIKSTSVKVE